MHGHLTIRSATAGALSLVALVACSAEPAASPVEVVTSSSSTGSSSSDPSDPSASTAPSTDSEDAGTVASPDDALWFYPPVSGASLTFVETGFETSTYTGTVTSVAGGTVDVDEQLDGVRVVRRFTTAFDGGTLLDPAGFGASGEGFEVTAVGDSMIIPSIAAMESGATSSGSTFVEFTGEGFSGRNDVDYTISGSGFASITVPAGTYDAYVVDFTLDITTSTDQQVSGNGSYWFVPGFAMVRQVTNISGQTLTIELTASTV